MCRYQSMVDADLLKEKADGQLDSLLPEELHVPSYRDREKEGRRCQMEADAQSPLSPFTLAAPSQQLPHNGFFC